MTEQHNTRPSASREIAVKKLEWGRAEADGMNLQADCAFGRYYIALRADGNWFWWRPASSPAHQGCEKSEDEAKAAAQADYERRILSAIDTTPGNTDPIAKYDDELRKVQGGWRDMDSAPRDGTFVILARLYELDGEPMSVVTFGHWTDGYGDGPDEMGMNSGWEDHHYSEFDPGRDFGNPKYIRKPRQPTHWMPLPPPPTEHPTEQPSVRDAARVLLKMREDIIADISSAHSLRGDGASEWMREDDRDFRADLRRAFDNLEAALRSLAQERE